MNANGALAVRARVPISLGRLLNGNAELVSFSGLADQAEHIAVVVSPYPRVPLVRLHSECLTGDVFGSQRCDCGPQLDEAMHRFEAEGGLLLYLRQEGRGIGLYNKLDTYLLQDKHIDTFTANQMIGRGADERDYQVAADMLHSLNIDSIRLLTNNPDKAQQLRDAGISVVTEPTGTYVTPENREYLQAKRRLRGHHLSPSDDSATRS